MENKIVEIITEPNKVYVGSVFKLKIKAIRHATYEELKPKTYNEVKSFSYKELGGM